MLLIEDRSLLERYRAGDPQALARVFEHYYPEVAAIAQNGFSFQSGGRRLRFKGYRFSADLFDVVHDVFRAAFEEKARLAYGGLQPYSAYLLTIARNLILSRLRHEEVAPDPLPLEAAGAMPAPGPSPEEVAHQNRQRALVQAFLAALSSEERDFTRLRFEEDLSQEAVAERMGVGRKKVRLLEEKVREKLRRYLAQRRAPHKTTTQLAVQ